MKIKFIKMQGAGNDYVYIDLIKNPYDVDFHHLAAKISDRHFGVGSDGLVLIMASSHADYRMRMFNADGSEAEMCGNAIRCVGKYLYDNGYIRRDTFSIETRAGIKQMVIVEKDRNVKALKLKVDMGKPILNGNDIPITIDANPVVGVKCNQYHGTAVSMGNPHFVIFVDKITDEMVHTDGPIIETDSLFPRRTNVEFVHVLNRTTIQMRVWERGAGETLACGTGASAAVVATVLNDYTERKVTVELLGGKLEIEWNEIADTVYLTGPAVETFSGFYFYS